MRPSKYTDELAEQIYAAIRDGATQKAAAGAVGITDDTLCNWKNAHPEFAEDVEKAKASARYTAETSLFKMCRQGNFAALKFWLKNRAGDEWSDKPAVEGMEEPCYTFEEFMAAANRESSSQRSATPSEEHLEKPTPPQAPDGPTGGN